MTKSLSHRCEWLTFLVSLVVSQFCNSRLALPASDTANHDQQLELNRHSKFSQTTTTTISSPAKVTAATAAAATIV